jgi:hypothetical protein
VDPSGHGAYCGDDYDPACLDENETEDFVLANGEIPGTLEENVWDYIPVLTNVRGIIRGVQTSRWASQQPSFQDQQAELRAWYNNCYGVCHGSSPIPGYSLGGPMPNTPVVDAYGQGMGETVGNVVDLGITVVAGSVVRTLPEPKLDTPRFGIRVAPFGNAGDGPLASQLPHFHFRLGPSTGTSYPGFGWRWHHPWDDIYRLFNLFK